MPVIDLDSVLAAIAPDDPCGPNLEYDPAFAELDRLAQGRPEQQIGATLVAAEDPDWRAVQTAALAVLARDGHARGRAGRLRSRDLGGDKRGRSRLCREPGRARGGAGRKAERLGDAQFGADDGVGAEGRRFPGRGAGSPSADRGARW